MREARSLENLSLSVNQEIRVRASLDVTSRCFSKQLGPYHPAQAPEFASFPQPRAEFLREVMLSHSYQHREQFSVYPRILNLAVPASWGPRADEPPLFAQRAQSAAVPSAVPR
jgi:hypothetical protein